MESAEFEELYPVIYYDHRPRYWVAAYARYIARPRSKLPEEFRWIVGPKLAEETGTKSDGWCDAGGNRPDLAYMKNRFLVFPRHPDPERHDGVRSWSGVLAKEMGVKQLGADIDGTQAEQRRYERDYQRRLAENEERRRRMAQAARERMRANGEQLRLARRDR